MDYTKTSKMVEEDFEKSIIPGLSEFVKIDNLSKSYDPEWNTNGKLEKACQHLLNWSLAQGVKGMKGEMYKEEGRSPMLVLEIEPNSDSKKNILLYGHFDKQPHMLPWADGLHPTEPVIKDGYLYGRGSSDDGYSTFTIVEAIKVVQQNGGKHGKIIITIEGGEESGSPDLIYYLKKLGPRVGTPDLMVCMDSGCIDYESLWLTTSLRGVLVCDLTVEVLSENVHSGSGSGICADSFNIIRTLLDRLDDPSHTKMIDAFRVPIPNYMVEAAKKLGDLQKEKTVTEAVKLLEGVEAMDSDYAEVILNNTWRPTLTVTGMTGFPPAETAGNVLRDKTSCRISIRLPPTADAAKVAEITKKILEENPPFNAKVKCEAKQFGYGWAAKDLCQVLKDSFSKSSQTLFGRDYYCLGEGGSIPFVYELGDLFPTCELLVTGVLGPKTNAHCPNECLNLKYTEKMTTSLAHAIADYCA